MPKLLKLKKEKKVEPKEPVIEVKPEVIGDRFEVVDINGVPHRKYFRLNGTTDIEIIE